MNKNTDSLKPLNKYSAGIHQSHPCTVCGALAYFEATHPDANLFRCPQCTHCFSDLGSIGSMESYEPDYFRETHKLWFQHPDVRLFARIHRQLSVLGSNASVMDVGCGNGAFLRFLRAESKTLSLTGIDLAPVPKIENVEFIQGDFLETEISKTFDCVVSLAVIEHVVDIDHFIKKMKAQCRTGGLVIISTVNDSGLIFQLARGLRKVGIPLAFNRLYSKHHLNHFNRISLPTLLEKNGMKVRKLLMHNSPYRAIDVPVESRLLAPLLRLGVATGGIVGTALDKTLLQTAICEIS